MKKIFYLFLMAAIFLGFGCSDGNPDAVDLAVEFSWEGMQACSMGNPEISVGRIPVKTKFLMVHMYDHVYSWDHGEATIPYNGSGLIESGVLEKIEGPCPPDVPGRYKITVKALDENKVVLGIGSKERYFPEKK